VAVGYHRFSARLGKHARRGGTAWRRGVLAGWEDPPMSVVEEAVAERLEGDRPGRVRAALAAIAIGAVVAVTAYRLLRSRASGTD
jgi:hypothetical protein